MPIGGWITLFVLIFVASRMLWVTAQDKRRDEIAIAFGRASLPCGIPQPSSDGKRLTYAQVSENSMGVFLHDLTTGQKKLIYDKNTKSFTLDLCAWPWSPDDRFFTYSAEDLIICDSSTGKEVARLVTEGPAGVVSLVWLTSEKLLYITRQGNIHVVELQPDGTWHYKLVPGLKKTGTHCLCAISTNTIAWQKGNRIWTLNLDSNQTGIAFEQPTGLLTEFNYSQKAKSFLLNTTENGTNALLSVPLEPSFRTNIVNLVQTTTLHNPAWIGNTSNGVVYLSANPYKPRENYLTLQTDRLADPITLFDKGLAYNFSLTRDGKKLFATGMVSNEFAAGIWEFDLTTGKLKEILPYTDHPSPHATRVEPIHGSITIAGRKVNYYVYQPPDFNRNAKKQYPLVLGNTYYVPMDPIYQNRVEGGLWGAALARCGAFVVIIERPVSWGFQIETWGENVWSVYLSLMQDQAISKNKVFLFSTSSETSYMCSFVTNHPSGWAGLMFFDGVSPDLDAFPYRKPAPKILLTAGDLEKREAELKRFQEIANQMGIRVDMAIDKNSGHVVLGRKPLTEKNQIITKFIFE